MQQTEVKITNFRHRKVRIGRFKVSLPLLIVVAIMIGATGVAAIAYVLMTGNISATVLANPKVCFYNWSLQSKSNSFSYSVDIFPLITTIDTNMTYGIWDWDTATHTVSMSWQSLSSPSNIASLGLKVYNATSIIYNQYWASVPSLPTAYINFSPAVGAGDKYTIYMNITATSGASGSSTFTFNLQVQNP